MRRTQLKELNKHTHVYNLNGKKLRISSGGKDDVSRSTFPRL